MTAIGALLTDELRGWIGREVSYTAREEIGRASIRYFALAIGDENPLYIDEAYARGDFEKHGFTYVSTSDVLRRPDDPRDQITYKGPMVGKTDRFVMVFRKSR